MLPSEYDLRVVELRYRDLRMEAAAHRLAQAAQPTAPARPSLVGRLMARVHLPTFGPAPKGSIEAAT